VAGVHGVTGNVVGTTDTQTLTNKTLTSPAVTGTQAGNLTYSGTATYTAAGAMRLESTSDASPTSTGHAFQIGLTSGQNIRMDNNELMGVNNGIAGDLLLNAAGGTVSMFIAQPSDSTTDVATIRGTVDANTFAVSRASALASAFTTKADADAVNRFTMRSDGLMAWGTGAATSDTNLFRGGANQLRTNDSVVIDGNLTVAGFSDLTPRVFTSGATATSGWSVTSQRMRESGGVKYVNVTWTRTGGDINVPSSGNITPDIQIGSVPSTWRPPERLYTGTYSGVGHGSVRINTDNTVDLLDWTSSGVIDTGENLHVVYVYID
jgi:hypothetical protein